MANHCYNWITITGDSDSIQKLIDKCEQPEVQNESLWYNTYHKLFPDTNKRYPGADEEDKFDVYEQYGSKWFDLGIDYPADKEYVNIMGDSAWSPMEPLCQKLSQAYNVEIRIEFEEGGCDFGGFAVYENGIETESETYTYRTWMYINDPPCFMENIAEEILCGDYYQDLDDFKENDKECWDVMSVKDKKELKLIFEEYAQQIKQEEIDKKQLKK